MPNSNPAKNAAIVIPVHAPIAAPASRLDESIGVLFANALYMAALNWGTITAMLKQLAPRARMPPSPKKIA